jgi:uncharacterized membrane protein YphA (DoxX/SURF4 family)
MKPGVVDGRRWKTATLFATGARLFLGAFFIYMGLKKALHPVEFLKLIRQYDIFHDYLWLNLVASTLPWFETFCGLLLLIGIAVRGTAVMLVTMLLPFSFVVLMRALDIRETSGLPFCAIKFDCGCGAGEVLICAKLAENLFLAGLSVWLVFREQSSAGWFARFRFSKEISKEVSPASSHTGSS